MSRSPAVPFSSLADILALRAVGNFADDAGLIAPIYDFADSDAFPVADRAAALRFLATEFFGFSGADAGEGYSDADFLAAYLASC